MPTPQDHHAAIRRLLFDDTEQLAFELECGLDIVALADKHAPMRGRWCEACPVGPPVTGVYWPCRVMRDLANSVGYDLP